VSLAAGASRALDPIDLSSSADGNLLRNSTLALRWVSAEGLDDWSLRALPAKLAAKTPLRDWEGEWIPLQDGVTYQLTARWKATSAEGGPHIFVRTKTKAEHGSLPTESASINAGTKEVTITGSPEAAWAQVCIRTPEFPATVLEAVSLRPMP
jgi:hypothetical protein